MTLKLLDEALKYFYNNSGCYFRIAEVEKAVYNQNNDPKVIKWEYIYKTRAIVEKLHKDQYLIEGKDFTYSISFDGAVFFEKKLFFIFKHRPYRNTAIMDNIKQIYTAAKVIMAAISTLAIICISYLTYAKDERIIVPEAKVINQPVQTRHDTVYIKSTVDY